MLEETTVIDRFLIEVAEVFEISADALKDDSVFVTSAPWDSLSVLSVISLVDEFYSVALSTSEIMRCKNLEDLLNIVRSRGGRA
jgi:acyl carrier protein